MEICVGSSSDYQVVGTWGDGVLVIDGKSYETTFDQVVPAAKIITCGKPVWTRLVK